jgi:cation:H+ antiporter
MTAWLTFAVSAAAVIAAGIRLARDGDTIAAGTGLGGMWIGAILLAAATSLPELVTDVSAVWQGDPGLAVGDLFGSSMANMLILAVADLLVRQTRVLTRVAVNQATVGVIGICLTTVAGLGVLAGGGSILGVGWATLVIAGGYVVGMRLLHANRPEPPFRTPAQVTEAKPRADALRSAVTGFAAGALVIVVAAPFLASSTAELAGRLGISHGFAGMVLLAITTSMPEVVVTTAAVRAGAYDLAVGNLLGSNCFNMAVLVPLDLAQGPGSLLAVVDRELAVAALASVVLTSLALLDVLDRAERRRWAFEPGPVLMIAAYAAGLYLTLTLHD